MPLKTRLAAVGEVLWLLATPLVARVSWLRRWAHPLFDAAFYGAQVPARRMLPGSAGLHYLLRGGLAGLDPHPLFDTSFYLERNPDVARAGLNPLLHFVRQGASEGRDPHPLFDTSYYLDSHPGVRESGLNPLVHFLRRGAAQGFDPGPRFSVCFYLDNNPDVRRSGMNPLVHFVLFGASEGRRAGPHGCDWRPPPVGAARLATTRSPRLAVKAVDALGPSERAWEAGARPATLAMRSAAPAVLCYTHVIPWPPAAGNAVRISRLLRWLQHEGFRVVLVVAPLPGEEVSDERMRAIARDFPELVVCDRDGEVRYVAHDALRGLVALHGRSVRGQGRPLADAADPRQAWLADLERTFCHDVLVDVVLHLQEALRPSVLIAEYAFMTRLLPAVVPGTLTVVDTHDVYSTRPDKVLSFGIDEWHLSPHEERRLLERAAVVVAIQEAEREALQRLLPAHEVVTAGVDFEVEDAPAAAARRVLLVASDNPMNVSGLRGFLAHAWPAVRAAAPDAELLVAGSVGLAVRTNAPAVRILGPVADLRELYRGAAVAINPAAAGTGLKVKTLEALAALRPIVTWPAGVDGMEPSLARLCAVAGDWDVFARRVLDVLGVSGNPWFGHDDRQTIAHALSAEHVYRDLAVVLSRHRARSSPSR